MLHGTSANFRLDEDSGSFYSFLRELYTTVTIAYHRHRRSVLVFVLRFSSCKTLFVWRLYTLIHAPLSVLCHVPILVIVLVIIIVSAKFLDLPRLGLGVMPDNGNCECTYVYTTIYAYLERVYYRGIPRATVLMSNPVVFFLKQY